MPNKTMCTKCGERHVPPRGRKCQNDKSNNASNVVHSTNIVSDSTENKLDKLLEMVTGIQDRVAGLEESRAEKSKTDSRPPRQQSPEPADSSSEDEDPRARDGANLSSLRGDAHLQESVQRRLRELGITDLDSGDEERDGRPQQRRKQVPTGKSKSGRSKTAADIAPIPVEWPHYHIFNGVDRTAAKYDELGISEFVHGYMCIVLDGEQESEVQGQMLQHLRDIMMDAGEFSWPAARNFHAIALQAMERGRLTWEDQGKIQDLRRTYAQKPLAQPATDHPNADQGEPVLVCFGYQDGTCRQQGKAHSSPKGTLRHMCAFCWRATGKMWPHPERECRFKKESEAAKN